MSKKSLRAELIDWLDAVSEDTWKPIADTVSEAAPMRSLGWVVSESDVAVTLAINFDRENQMASPLMHIPKSMIVKRTKVKV